MLIPTHANPFFEENQKTSIIDGPLVTAKSKTKYDKIARNWDESMLACWAENARRRQNRMKKEWKKNTKP